MADLVVLKGLEAVVARLKANAKKYGKTKELAVGFEAPYAIYVHEDLMANHPNGGQAKYLEQPAREMKDQLGWEIRDAVKAGKTLEEGMLQAGQKLLDAAKELVPVDTGFLRDSGFVEVVEK